MEQRRTLYHAPVTTRDLPLDELDEPAQIRWTGQFAESHLERAFRVDDLESLRRFLHFSIALSSLSFLAFALHDALVVPEVRDRAWAVRFGVFVPASALASWLVNSRHLPHLAELVMLGYGLCASFIVLYIAVIAGGSG